MKNLIQRLFKGKKMDINTRPSFWYMTDYHTFIKPLGKSLIEIKEKMLVIAKENPFGMVCTVTILEEGKPERSVGMICHVDKDGNVNLDKWYEEIMKEDCVRLYKGEQE